MTGTVNDLRSYVAAMLDRGEVAIVEREVDPEFELAAVVSRSQKLNDRPVLFRNVRGSAFPVIANVYGSLNRMAEILGADAAGLNERWNERLDTASTCTDYCREVAIPSDLQSGKLSDLPHIHYREKDAAPYITTGVFLAMDPETGVPNLSFSRCMMSGNDARMECCIDAPHDLAKYQAKAEARGEALEVAILIGAPPPVFLAAVASLAPEEDELQLAAHIAGGTIDMRPSRCLNFMVPAATEIVIEARIRPIERTRDGPFGEYLGYYCGVNNGAYVLDILDVRWRKDAYFEGLLCGSREDLALLAVSWGARIERGLKRALPGILDVTIGAAPSASIVRIDKQYEGHARDVIETVFRSKPQYNRMCIVVDKDIDIQDLKTVWWSFLTRGDLDKRVYRYSDLGGLEGENYEYSGYLGIDATMSLSSPLERATTPGENEIDLKDYVKN
ncbi:MAG: UbiD family decarboxylase [Novosphingobium sp.]